MNASEIEAPVLLFGPNYDTVEFIRDENWLSQTNKLGLKKGVVLGNIIVDSSGKVYRTIGATRKGNVNPIWMFEFFNPMIYIQLEVEIMKRPPDFSAVKVRILKIIDQEQDLWEKYDSVERIKLTVEACRSHRELIQIIGSYVAPVK